MTNSFNVGYRAGAERCLAMIERGCVHLAQNDNHHGARVMAFAAQAIREEFGLAAAIESVERSDGENTSIAGGCRVSEQQKVYAVSAGEYSDYHIKAVFSTREGAERYRAECLKTRYDREVNDIEEWALDTDGEMIAREYWVSEINQAGTLRQIPKDSYSFSELALPQEKTIIRDFENRADGKRVEVKSYISQEHADKVAIEQWQMRLMDGRWCADAKPPSSPPPLQVTHHPDGSRTIERTAEAGGVSPAEVVAALREASEPPPVDASTAKLIETFGQDAADAIRSRAWPVASLPPPPG